MAATLAGSTVAPAPGLAQTGGAPEVPPDQTAEVEARLQEVIRRYGDRLSEDQRTRLRRVLTQNVRMLQAIRTFPLQNGDAPATSLKLAVEKTPGAMACPKDEHAR